MNIQTRMRRWRDDLDDVLDGIVTLRLSRRLWDDLVPAVNEHAEDWGSAGEVLTGWYADSVLIQARRLLDRDSRTLSLRTVLYQVKDQASLGRVTLESLQRLHGGPFEPDYVGWALARIVNGADLVEIDRLKAIDIPPPVGPIPDRLTPEAVQDHLDLLDTTGGVIVDIATQHVAHRQRHPDVDSFVDHRHFDEALETVGALARHWMLLFGGPDVSLDVDTIRHGWRRAIGRVAGRPDKGPRETRS